MATILITTLSENTIPCVQLIKEMKDEIDDYFFVTTKEIEYYGSRTWIGDTLGIDTTHFGIVEAFLWDSVSETLDKQDFSKYDRIIVNIKCGTKVMFASTYYYFLMKYPQTEFIYIYQINKIYRWKLTPDRFSDFEEVKIFSKKLSLSEYLAANGVSVVQSEPIDYPFEMSEKIFKAYCRLENEQFVGEKEIIRLKRNKVLSGDEFDTVKPYLDFLGFVPEEDGKLSKKETKFLSGEWFEQYVGFKIKQELGLSDEDILIGAEVRKNAYKYSKNDPMALVGAVAELETSDNEMDVMFVYNNEFYSIECKTSIIDAGTGKIFLGETIYKSDSLQYRFGIQPHTAIMTLSDISECAKTDGIFDKNKVRNLNGIINRANISFIKLVDKKIILNTPRLFDTINPSWR